MPLKSQPAGDDDPIIFSARLTPHRSLSERGFFLLMLIIAAISFAAGMVFLLVGAWPVFGFFGLDVLLIYWALKANYRSAAAYEEVLVTASALRVRQVSASGAVQEWALNPLWTQLERQSDPEFGVYALALIAKGQKLPIAQHLGPQEKGTFAAALAAALSEAKRGPVRTVLT